MATIETTGVTVTCSVCHNAVSLEADADGVLLGDCPVCEKETEGDAAWQYCPECNCKAFEVESYFIPEDNTVYVDGYCYNCKRNTRNYS